MATLSSTTQTAAASISITANGTTRVNGTLTWTAPPAPAAEATLISIVLSGGYTWDGRGNFTLTINGQQVASGAQMNVTLPLNATSPYTITGVGGNRNATGANCNFTNLIITYTYEISGEDELIIKEGGTFTHISRVLKKQGGALVELDITEDILTTSQKLVRR